MYRTVPKPIDSYSMKGQVARTWAERAPRNPPNPVPSPYRPAEGIGRAGSRHPRHTSISRNASRRAGARGSPTAPARANPCSKKRMRFNWEAPSSVTSANAAVGRNDDVKRNPSETPIAAVCGPQLIRFTAVVRRNATADREHAAHLACRLSASAPCYAIPRIALHTT